MLPLNLFVVLAWICLTFAQDPSLVGTWSSGTQKVVPGPGFADPAQETFTYPRTSGVGYSFSDDGWYELARFRYVANSSHPECIIATVIWAHGTYQLSGNGSLTLTPAGDGYQQVQAPCTGKSNSDSDQSNFVQNYNTTEVYSSYRIYNDVTFGPKLHLFEFDGRPVAPLFRVSEQPTMLPKEKLRNIEVQVVTTTRDGLVTVETLMSKRSNSASDGVRHAAQRRAWWPVW
ncbi:chaperone for protein-folding within the ER, fungal-domain-containing protein [Favolaschia claudopus]|uniref:Protein ROT1 n=1 Tax=Favolaschia claudopus TaxID=2862362 RepID=A0AAW0C6Y7_9AGAR